MSIIRIHPDFKLQEQSFADVSSFLSYVKETFPQSYSFLKNLFSDSKTILVGTSGSTGLPKNIRIPKKALLASAEATGQLFELPTKTKALHCLSSDYIAGKMMWVRALHLGWHLEVVSPGSNPLKYTEDGYDFVAMVPLQVQNSLTKLHRIKKLIIGGGPISFSLEQQIKDLSTLCYQTYGMTETITHIAIKKLTNDIENYYKCLPNIKVHIDKRNCLLIEAPYISKQLLVTNDIVRLISDSTFEWIGRYDNVINSGGIKLFPEQIETKLAPFISIPFIIGGLHDEKLGQKLVLLIESNQKVPNLEKLLLNSDLSHYEIPKETHYILNFIYTKNGKINRNDSFSLINK